MFSKAISDAQFRMMVESTPEATVVVADECIAACNPAAEQLSGFLETELKTLPFSVLIAPDDQKRALKEIGRRIAGQPAEPRPVYRMRRKDGVVYWAEIHGLRIDWQGKPAVLAFWRETAQKIRTEDKKAPMPGLLDPVGRDPLTDTFDHEAYVEELERIDVDAHHPITLIIAELDELEATVANFGQAAGDELLRTFAGFLKKETRAGDFVARIENHRFAVLLKRTDAWMAEGIQRRIVDDLASRSGAQMAFSASFGIGTKTARQDSFGTVFQEALKKLDNYRRMMRR